MALSLAVEEQTEDGSRSLRDTMIWTALEEGNSVEDVAEALGLTTQAVYRVRAEHQPEPRGLQAVGSDERAVVVALEQMTNSMGFEELVNALIDDIEPAAIPLGGPGDRGRDAADPDSEVIFTISLDRQWKRKVESDLAKLKKHGYTPKKVFSATNRRTSRKAVEALVEKAAKDDIALTVLDQKWLVAKLGQPRYLHLRTGILNVPPPRSPSFLAAKSYRELLNGRPHLAGLTAHFIGRQVETRRAAELLERDGVVLLSGAGGYGKTRIALELAEGDDGPWRFIDSDMPFIPESISELPVSPRLVVVIDNAHRREDLGTIVAALANLPKGLPRIVLLSRPGYLERLNGQLASSAIGPIDEPQIVEIGPLGWRSMAAILKEEPLGIESPEQRGAIVHLAEGNPQIAVLAARVARERQSVIGLSGDELLQRYLAYLIPTAIPADSNLRRQRQLLALLAALDGIENDDDSLVGEVAEVLRISPEQVLDGLDQLAESGLVIADRARHRIKPDLLAEHVLFALTLTERWQLALDYRLIFERFGARHLFRLAKAVGALPFGLFDDEVAERLYGLEHAVATAVQGGDPVLAASLVRELCRGRPETGKRFAFALLDRLSGDPPSEQVIERLREGAMRMADFERSWRLLLRLAAVAADTPTASKAVGEAMSETYQRIPEGDTASGAILAAVQDSLATETRRFWRKQSPGAASAIALAIKPMLSVTFTVRRTSADDPMSIEFGHRTLPDSSYTQRVVNAGGELAAEVFPALTPAQQLALLETLGWAAHAAAGFSLSMGAHAPMGGRILLDRALGNVDFLLGASLEDLAMPVRRAAYDYLLKRARYRRKLAEEQTEEGIATKETSRFEPIEVPAPGPLFDDFLFVINNTRVGPPDPDRLGIKEEFARTRTRARLRAEKLLTDELWRETLDRWSAWWHERLDLEKQPALGTTVGMVLEALAKLDAQRGLEAVDHLVTTQSELRGSAAAAMAVVIAEGPDSRWKDWVRADAITRATVARALSNFDQATAAEALRVLAVDPDESVRGATLSALAFSADLDQWKFDLGLEAVARYPDIDALGQLLHMADEHASKPGEEGATFELRQLELIESAVIATSESDRIDAYQLADSLRRVERDSRAKGLTMRWIWARVDALERIEGRRRGVNLWNVDFLDDELSPLVAEVATSADLEEALARFRRVPARSPALPDLATVIKWIDGSSEQVTELMIELLEDDEKASSVRSHLMDLPLNDEQMDHRAMVFATELEEPLSSLLDLISGSLPNSWSGSYVPHLENGLSIAKRWAASSQRRLAEAGREAVRVYERQIRTWEAREATEDLEFDYR